MSLMPMRDGGDQWRFVWRIFACGLLFYIAARAWPDAMPVQVYGQMAYDIDAETWSLGFMSASGMAAYGIHINGRWRWSPVLRLSGYLLLLMMFAYLVGSAITAQFGAVVAIFGGMFFIPMLVGFLRINLADFLARFNNGTD